MQIKTPTSALLEQSLGIIRNKDTRPVRFRNHLRKIGRYLIYEASKNFELENSTVQTPLETAVIQKMKHQVVIISVLRAALPMVDAIFEEFDDASLGVASASRGEMLDSAGTKFKIESDYMKIPDVSNKIVVFVDPMLATASTISYLLKDIKKQNPVKIVLISAIAAQFGIDVIEEKFPEVEIYCAAVDDILNDHGYIVPGLGDAGDRACNTPHM